MNVKLTKIEACELLKINTYDTAIPQEFFNKMQEIFDNMIETKMKNESPLNHFVWSYDINSFGSPRPLTIIGLIALDKYNEKYNCNYNTEIKVLDC